MSTETEKLKVFVSYSRTDSAFADQLVLLLEDRGFEAIIDRHDIGPAEEWKKRLGELIFSCDKVVFVLTKRSATSKICKWEVERAVRLQKPMIPVIIRPIEGVTPPQQLADLQYIRFYKDSDIEGSGIFNGAILLEQALKTDLAWMRQQTRLLEQAQRYKRESIDALLLRGEELASAISWATLTPRELEVPTQIADFISISEKSENLRIEEAKANFEEREAAIENARRAVEEQEIARQSADKASRRLRLVALAGSAIAAVLIVIAGYFSAKTQGKTLELEITQIILEEQSSNFIAREARSIFDSENGDHTESLLMALRADPADQRNQAPGAFGYPEAQSILQAALIANRLKTEQRFEGTGVADLLLNADGIIAAAFAFQNGVDIIDIKDGSTVRIVEEGISVKSLDLSPDGNLLAVGFSESLVKFYDATTGDRIREFSLRDSFSPNQPEIAKPPYVAVSYSSDDNIQDVAISADNNSLIARSARGALQIWDLQTNEASNLFGDVDFEVLDFVAIPNDRLVTVSEDYDESDQLVYFARHWDLSTGEVLNQNELDKKPTSVEVSSNSRKVALGFDDGELYVTDFFTEENEVSFDVAGSTILDISFSPDGNFVATLTDDNRIRVFDLLSETQTDVFSGHRGGTSFLQFFLDGSSLVSSGHDHDIRSWNYQSELSVQEISDLKLALIGTHFSSQKDIIASVDEDDGKVGFWDVGKKQFSLKLGSESENAETADIAIDGSTIALGHSDARVSIWDMNSGELLTTINQFRNDEELVEAITIVKISPDASLVATATDYGTLSLWNLKTGEPVGQMVEYEVSDVIRISFSGDGARLVSVANDYAGTATIWNTQTGDQLWQTENVIDAVFSPKHNILAVAKEADRGRSLELLAADSGALVDEILDDRLKTHRLGTFWRLDFSPDGRFFTSATETSGTEVFHTDTRALLFVLTSPETNFPLAEFSQDGRQILTVGEERSAVLWQMPDILFASPIDQVQIACDLLRSSGAQMSFSDADIEAYPILKMQLNEPDMVEAGPGELRLKSPCSTSTSP